MKLERKKSQRREEGSACEKRGKQARRECTAGVLCDALQAGDGSDALRRIPKTSANEALGRSLVHHSGVRPKSV
jgi:hypothetical protein